MSWRQYDDDYVPSERQEPKYSLDRMLWLEEYTDYEFSKTDKVAAFARETDEKISNTVTNVTQQVGHAIKTNWSIVKYAPIFWMVAITVVILSWSKWNPLKKLKKVFT